MRRARSTPGNHRSVSSHLQRPVSPLPSIRKRNLFIGPFEENPPNKKLRESVEVLADDTSEPLDNHSESNSEASAYEDCKSVGSEPDFGMDSDHSSVSPCLGRPIIIHLTYSLTLGCLFSPV